MNWPPAFELEWRGKPTRAMDKIVDPPRFEDDSEEELVKIRKQEGRTDPRAAYRVDLPPDAWRQALSEGVPPRSFLPVLVIEPEELARRQAKNKRRNRARFRARELRRLSGSSEPAPAVLPAPAPVAAVNASRPDQPIGAVLHRPTGEPGPEADLIAAMRKLARGKIIPVDYMEMILPPDWTPEERAFLEEMTRVIAFNQSNPESEPDILAVTRDIARGS